MDDVIDWTGCEWVERVAGRMGGLPTIVGTRVTPETVLMNFEDCAPEEIAEMFELDEAKVRGVLVFAGHLQAAA